MNDEILRAIHGRRLVELRYQDRTRTVEPHDYGVLKGAERLFVYQLRVAPTRTGRPDQGWRLLDVAKITDLRVLHETFRGSRGDAHQSHHDWDQLYARVE